MIKYRNRNGPGDIRATITLIPTDKGGRKGPTPSDELRPILMIDGTNWSISLNLEDTGSVAPGQTVTIPIYFFDLEGAREHLSVGKKFTIWEGITIANGVIDEILFAN